MAKKARTRANGDYQQVKPGRTTTATTDFPPSDEALAARRAEVERAEGYRVSLQGAKPEDVLRTMLATPPLED